MTDAPGLVARTNQNLEKCRCMECPTYTFTCTIKNMPGNMMNMMRDIGKVDHAEVMFCTFGRSQCITDEKECICIACDVYRENHLDKMFYCLGGRSPIL